VTTHGEALLRRLAATCDSTTTCDSTMTMAKKANAAASAAVALLSVGATSVAAEFVCGASGSGTSYNATIEYVGCYLDSSVSILGQAKFSSIGMTPQFCGNYCGQRGYAYGGVEFGT
jgi:xylan 1,4-beta-xylosidase